MLRLREPDQNIVEPQHREQFGFGEMITTGGRSLLLSTGAGSMFPNLSRINQMGPGAQF